MKKLRRGGFIVWVATGLLHASIYLAAAGEAKSLRPLVDALRESGRDILTGRELAEALGIPIEGGEEGIVTKGEAFETGGVVRAIQTPASEQRDYVLFMVQKDNEVWFYLANSAGSLMKALRRDRAKKENAGLDLKSAESAFRAEIAYWERELKIGSR
jgi:hypothetical protein